MPVDVNGINKLAGENYHLLYSNVYSIHSSVLRLTNTYGPRMRIKDARQTFLGIWISCLLQCQPFEVWGGDQLRDYTYVDDCVQALLLASSNTAAVGQIYNLGGLGTPVSLIETAETLVSAAKDLGLSLPSQPFIVSEYPEQRKKIDIGDYYADYSKLQDHLCWKPMTSLRDCLRQTLQFYASQLEYYL